MKILAIEQSTAVSSVALLADSSVLAERVWNETRTRNQQLFSALPEIFKETSVEPSDIGVFAVGLGPGSFSGLRISLSTVRGLALPREKPVTGVSSGEALACDISRETGNRHIVTVGDARRNRLWFARFEEIDQSLTMKTPYALIKLDEFPDVLKKGSTVVTPDWDRIGEELKKLVPSSSTLIKEMRAPRAQTVGKLALKRIENNQPTEKLSPIYLHPPVFVQPKFGR